MMHLGGSYVVVGDTDLGCTVLDPVLAMVDVSALRFCGFLSVRAMCLDKARVQLLFGNRQLESKYFRSVLG
jgi:hypothetical protein